MPGQWALQCMCVTSSSSPALVPQWQFLRHCVKYYIRSHQSEMHTVPPLYVHTHICCVHVLHRRLTNHLTSLDRPPNEYYCVHSWCNTIAACCQLIVTRVSLRPLAPLATLRQTPPFPSLSVTPPPPPRPLTPLALVQNVPKTSQTTSHTAKHLSLH